MDTLADDGLWAGRIPGGASFLPAENRSESGFSRGLRFSFDCAFRRTAVGLLHALYCQQSSVLEICGRGLWRGTNLQSPAWSRMCPYDAVIQQTAPFQAGQAEGKVRNDGCQGSITENPHILRPKYPESRIFSKNNT